MSEQLDEAIEPGEERKLTPEEQQLPSHLVKRIEEAVRLVGLPLAVDTGQAGVYLEREGAINGPIDHVVISWHVTDRLFNAAEGQRPDQPAEQLMSVAYTAIEEALAAVLTASGLVVAKHPYTHSLAVWGADGPPPLS